MGRNRYKLAPADATKVRIVKLKIQELIPQLQENMRALRDCRPTPATVAARAGRLFGNLSAMEAGIAALGTRFPPATLVRVRRYKALVNELPQLSDIPAGR